MVLHAGTLRRIRRMRKLSVKREPVPRRVGSVAYCWKILFSIRDIETNIFQWVELTTRRTQCEAYRKKSIRDIHYTHTHPAYSVQFQLTIHNEMEQPPLPLHDTIYCP